MIYCAIELLNGNKSFFFLDLFFMGLVKAQFLWEVSDSGRRFDIRLIVIGKKEEAELCVMNRG